MNNFEIKNLRYTKDLLHIPGDGMLWLLLCISLGASLFPNPV